MGYLRNIKAVTSVIVGGGGDIRQDLINIFRADTVLSRTQKVAMINIVERYSFRSDRISSVEGSIQELVLDIGTKSWEELGQPTSLIDDLDAHRDHINDLIIAYLISAANIVIARVGALAADPSNFVKPARE